MEIRHQYIDRKSGEVRTEQFYGDRMIKIIYSTVRERVPILFKALTSPVASSLMGYFNYELAVGSRISGLRRFCADSGIDLSDAVEPREALNTPARIFERRIRYWETRPLPSCRRAVVSPADARVIVGSLDEISAFFIKEKFFDFKELFSVDKTAWHHAFTGGAFAILRLTPDKYHYTHMPVSGQVEDIYEIDGRCHSCNPNAVISVVTPYSKNRRLVTVINTDVDSGTGIGHVAIVEVAAMLVGGICQCYSREKYLEPVSLEKNMVVERGAPKILFRPGSSVVVVMFQKGRVEFAEDLVKNSARRDVESRFTADLSRPLVETDVMVRSLLAVSSGA